MFMFESNNVIVIIIVKEDKSLIRVLAKWLKLSTPFSLD